MNEININETDSLKWSPLFDVIGDLVSIHGVDGSILKVNKAFADFFGKPAEELIGQKCFCLFHSCSEFIEGCPVAAMIESGHNSRCEVKINSLTFEVSAFPVKNDDKKIIGGVHVARDITFAKKKTLELLQFRSAMDDAGDGMLITDAVGKPIYINVAFSYLAGITKDKANTFKVKDVLRDGSIFDEIVNDISYGTYHKEEMYFKQHQSPPCELKCSAVLNDGLEVDSLLWVFTDITERKAIEEAKEYKEKLNSIVEMAGGISHEINQPLTVFAGYVDLMGMKFATGNEKMEAYIEKMKKEVSRLREISKRLSKITTYKTITYVGNSQIVDINKSSSDSEL